MTGQMRARQRPVTPAVPVPAGSRTRLLQRCDGKPCATGACDHQLRSGHDFSQVRVHSDPRAMTAVAVSDPADPSEVEAERVADEVMRAGGADPAPTVATSAPVLARAVVRPEDLADSVPEEEVIALGDAALPAPSASGAGGPADAGDAEEVAAQIATARSPAGPDTAARPPGGLEAHLATARSTGGSSLPGPVLGTMEARFGSSFSAVRVHDDGAAHELSRSVGAFAVTTGRDIFFATGQYQPGSPGGQRLLAHELTHVIQQRKADGPVTRLARTSSGAMNCPPYNGYNRSKDLATYNCAGLAHRTYDFKSLDDTKALLAGGTAVSAGGMCGSVGTVQHWLWEYDIHVEDSDGKSGASWRDFHTVGGPTDGDPLPQPPSEVYTKNGKRKVYGPGTGPSFKPVVKDQARSNDPADLPMTDPQGRPLYKVRSNFTETSSCLPCPGQGS